MNTSKIRVNFAVKTHVLVTKPIESKKPCTLYHVTYTACRPAILHVFYLYKLAHEVKVNKLTAASMTKVKP